MFQILMVCTGNICRSPMAAFLLPQVLRPDLGPLVRVTSAGTHAMHGHPAEPLAVAAMAQLGVEIGSHRARQLSSDLIRSSNLVLTMEVGQMEMAKSMLIFKKSKIRLLTEFDPDHDDPNIADPYDGTLAAYQTCIQTLRPCLAGLVSWLLDHLSPSSNQQNG